MMIFNSYDMIIKDGMELFSLFVNSSNELKNFLGRWSNFL